MGERVRREIQMSGNKVAGVVFFVVCSLLFFWLLNSRRSISANNDAFLQLMAAQGIIEGAGYGFYEGEKFISIGERMPETRWPPGLTLVAAVLERCSVRPLEWISGALPWVGTLSLVVLAAQVHRELGVRPVEAMILALAVTGTGAFLDWHGEVGTEAFFFLLLVCTTWAGALRGPVWAVPFIWMMTLFRTAGIYLAAGLAALYGMERSRRAWSFVLRSAAAFAVLGGPLLAFHAYYGLSDGRAPNRISSIGEQILGQIFLLHEVISPHTYFMKDVRPLGTLLGIGILLTAIAVAWRAFRHVGTGLNLVTACAVMGISYFVLLAASAVAVGYDWASVYRVSSMSVILIGIAFWFGAFAFAPSSVIRRIVLGAAILVVAAKIGFTVVRHPNPAFQRDYRATVGSFRVYSDSLGSGPVAICAADSFERNISYGLLYALKHGEALPRPVLWMAFGEGIGSSECHTVDQRTREWMKRDLRDDRSGGKGSGE